MLFLTWIASVAAIVTIAYRLEGWLTPAGRQKLNGFVNKRILHAPHTWLSDVSEGFLLIFDRIFGWDGRPGQRAVWTGILFTYGVFPLAHLVLFVFGIPTPSTELILGAVFFVSIEASLLVALVFKGLDILPYVRAWRQSGVRLKFWPITSFFLLGMAPFFIVVIISSSVIYGIGVSIRNLVALALGASLAFPLMCVVSQIPIRHHPVNPIKSMVSSIFWVTLLGFLFPDAAVTFLLDDDIQRLITGQIESIPDDILDAVAHDNATWLGPIFYLVYNLAADVISLAETRYILKKSLRLPFIYVLALLVTDVVLSLAIFITLPLIAGQDFQDLQQAIYFDGPVPYLGLLFWSTFATSFAFYLFVLSSALLLLFSPLSAFTRGLSAVFDLEQYPLAAIAAVMIVILTVGVSIVGFITI